MLDILKDMMSRKSKMKFHEEDKKYFKDVVFLVEATSHEDQFLWTEWSADYLTLPYAPKEEGKFARKRVDWQQVSLGHMLTIGEIDNRPICVSMSYAIINGRKIMFYEGCSQLVDHEMIREWLKHFTLNTIRWDGGTRWGHCDAMNFHHCLDAIKELNEGK